jgi:hypothetical protein
MSHLITCPDCNKHLQVPDELMGKKVQCPECKHTFIAAEAVPTEVVSSTGTTASKPKSAPTTSAPKKAEWDRDDDEEEDTGSRKSKPAKKKTRADDDDGDLDDDDDDDRPSRRRRSRYRRNDYMPHRGGMILAFGILSLAMYAVFAPLALIFGPMAWIMGNFDMAEIRSGRMDPEGESMVQVGRVMGIVSTLIGILGGLAVLVLCCLIPMMGAALNPRGRG